MQLPKVAIAELKSDGDVFEMGYRKYSEQTDQGLVLHSWVRKAMSCPPFTQNRQAGSQGMTSEEVNDHKNRVILDIIKRSPPVIACHPDHPEQIFGYCASEDQGETPVLHFIYVRDPFRRVGIATQLLKVCLPGLKSNKGYYTHNTLSMRYLAPKWNVSWDPFRVHV